MKNLKNVMSVIIVALMMMVSVNVSAQDYERIFTDEQIKLIGEGHNDFLLKIFKNFNWDSKDKISELTKNSNLNYSDPDKDFDLSKHKLTTIDELKKLVNNSSDFIYFENIINLDIENMNLTTVNNFVNSNSNVASNKMTSVKNYEALLVFSSVYLKSFEFWMPKSNGGMGKFEEYNRLQHKSKSNSGKIDYMYNNSNVGWKDCLTDVLVADGGAAGGACLTGGIIAGVTSAIVSPWAFVARIVASAGWSSGIAYFSSVEC